MEYTDEQKEQDLRIVNWLIRKKIKGRSLDFMADDMRQVAHIKLWELRRDGKWQNVTYAITCAYNAMLNCWRETKKHLDTQSLDIENDDGVSRLERTQASKITADDILRGGELAETIKRLIEKYTARNQKIIYIRNYAFLPL